MQDFWQFAGSYWWLIFPIFGIASGAAARIGRHSKVRHQRRLEVIAARRDLRAAEIQARTVKRAVRKGMPVPEYMVPVAAPAVPEDHAPTRKSEQERLVAEHEAITKRWLEYELDVAKLIAFPAMSDARNDLTAAFLRAGRKADSLKPETGTKLDAEGIRSYREAVVDYGSAFDVAERDAKRVKDHSFTEDERKRLDRAQQLLKVALDQAATPAERQVAYRRVRDELDGLLLISDDAIVVLEKQVAGELTVAPDSPTQAEVPQAQPVAEPLRREESA